MEDNFHLYEKEHRYSNEEFFQRDKDLKDLQLEFKHFISHRLKEENYRIETEQVTSHVFVFIFIFIFVFV